MGLHKIRKVLNTYLPVPVKLRRSGFSIGIKDILDGDAKIWRDEDYYKVSFYEEMDGLAKELVAELVSVANQDEKILDICCNVGRHMNCLTSKGYLSVYGFDVMPQAIERMPGRFPGINMAHVRNCNILSYFAEVEDGFFDWAYTHTATIELLHPSWDLAGELKRTVRKGFVFLLNEDGHSYPRYYGVLFARAGFSRLKWVDMGGGISLQTWVKRI